MILDDEFSDSLIDLISKLLEGNPSKRLGANGAGEIMSHPYFKGINWDFVRAKKYALMQPKITLPKHLIQNRTSSTVITMDKHVKKVFGKQGGRGRAEKTEDADFKLKFNLMKSESLYAKNSQECSLIR